MNWKDYKVDVPEGKSGNVAIERFEISEQEASFHGLRCAINARYHRRVEAGTYTRIGTPTTLWMSDTRARDPGPFRLHPPRARARPDPRAGHGGRRARVPAEGGGHRGHGRRVVAGRHQARRAVAERQG